MPEEVPLPKWSLWTSLSYVVVMVVIGLPLWWKTTTVQRVSLPYEDMLSYHNFLLNNFKQTINIRLKNFKEPKDFGLTKVGDYEINSTFSPLSVQESQILLSEPSIQSIDKKLCSISHDETDLSIILLSSPHLIKEYSNKLIVGNCHTIYYVGNENKLDGGLVQSVLDQMFDTSKSSLELPLADGYEVLFSLLVPEPQNLNMVWDIERGINDYIEPLLSKLRAYSSFSLRSQILYYTHLNISPKKVGEAWEVAYSQLPLIINPVESKLGSFVSQNPSLNFIVYTSPCSQSPIALVGENGNYLGSNGFFVPQWGGIQFYNEPSCHYSSRDVKIPLEVNIERVMSVVLSQMLSLIGIPKITSEEIIVLDHKGSALREWEIDFLLRRRLQRLLFTTSNTLMSLGNLLDQITNIVVKEEVGAEVEKSVKNLKLSYQESVNNNINLGLLYGVEAYKSSEIAFHHPSNLAQLYFPDDQKYAIYIPLFLPVGIPVILSLKSILAHLKS